MHARLGHPSTSNLKNVQDIFVISPSNNSCRVCLRAKHTCTSFFCSLSNAKHIFELIRSDLWGPYHQSSLCDSFYFFNYC